ncbi:MAG: hypothetical protein MRERV_46c014 [Mycoplasmataceae bacterium RV_VA103A]|nr:MAG: hypothetical protein MRERV_46c014 [Mycoplasmataceae bacterium RV_VA103A]
MLLDRSDSSLKSLLFVFLLFVPALVVHFFIKRNFEKFFFKKLKWRKNSIWDNERIVEGFSMITSIFYVLLVSFAYFYLFSLVIQ